MTNSAGTAGQLGHSGNHNVPILTPESTWSVIIPAHQRQGGLVLLAFSLGSQTKVERNFD